MERFIRGDCYVVVKAKDWGEFAGMCDSAGVGWGPRRTKASEYTPRPIMEGKPLRVFVLDGILLHASPSSPKTRDIPVMGFQNLKPLSVPANAATILSDGVRVTAHLIANGQVIRSRNATCSPEDTFRFGPGAVLAMFRALQTEEDRVLAMDLIGEERIRQLEPEIPNVRDLVGGKKNAADADMLGGMLADALSTAFGTKVVVVHKGETRSGKSPFLHMVEEALASGLQAGVKR